MKIGQFSNLLRSLSLIYLTDWVRFYIQKIINYNSNKRFKLNNRHVQLPPDYLIYESFHLNYHKYYTESTETAKWLINLLRNHTDLNGKQILDWGCGPGRIVRNLPYLLGSNCSLYATDYNPQSIEWCVTHLKGNQFKNNTL